MRALVFNCTLKASPARSNTEVLAQVLVEALRELDVESDVIRVVDHDVRPGVSSTRAG